MRPKDGGPAFPVEEVEGPAEARHRWVLSYGMSLRDYFAGQAITGVLASQHREAWDNPDKAAVWAYEYADAMLAAREES